jgi:hypothetical protein
MFYLQRELESLVMLTATCLPEKHLITMITKIGYMLL